MQDRISRRGFLKSGHGRQAGLLAGCVPAAPAPAAQRAPRPQEVTNLRFTIVAHG